MDKAYPISVSFFYIVFSFYTDMLEQICRMEA